MNPETIHSIVLFKLRYIGDVILTTPAIRLLRQTYPKASITMVVNQGTEDVLRYNPHLDRVLVINRSAIKDVPLVERLRHEGRFLRTLRENPYDLSVDFDSGERSAFLAWLSRTRYRVGFRYPKGWRRWIFTHQVRRPMRMHTVEQNLLLLEQSLNIVRRDAHLELYTGPEEERRMTAWVRRNGLMEKDWVTLHTGGRYWFKRWSSAKWARLADVIQGEMGVRVVFVGGAGEAETVREIASWMKTSPLTLVGETTVLELAAFLRKSLLLVGNDSGPMHMASAVGTPVIALFGPTDPAVWRPWGKGHVVLSRQVSCSPCGRLTCDLGPENCMEQISFDEVLQAVCQCLEKPVPPPSTVRSNH